MGKKIELNRQVAVLPFDELQDEYLRRKSLLDELHQTRDSITQSLETINARIQAVEQGRELYVGQKSQPKQTPEKKFFKNDLSVSEHAINLIMQHGPMTALELAKGVLDGGYQTISTFDIFVRSVATRLRKESSRFKKLDGAKYGLVNDASQNGNGDGSGRQDATDGNGSD